MEDLSAQLHILCLDFINQRVATAEYAIAQARAAANDDTKSSAGDKFETTREMMQQDIDRNKLLLADALLQKQLLDRITAQQATQAIARLGSIVFTDNGNFYLSISAGALKVNGDTFYAVSTASPIGAMLVGKKEKEAFSFNGKAYCVSRIVH